MLEVQPTGQSGRTATGSGRNGRDRTTVIWSGPVHVVTISLHTPLMGTGKWARLSYGLSIRAISNDLG